MTVIIPGPYTPITPRTKEEGLDPKLNTFAKGTEMSHNQSYSRNRPLEFTNNEPPVGSNLPGSLRGALARRNCFIVHSD